MKSYLLRRFIRPLLFTLLLMTVPLFKTALIAAGPPVAEKRPHSLTRHGVEWTDDYFWIREREKPEVRTYLEAENAYLDAELAPLKPLREKLVTEMKSRIIEEDVTVP